MRNETREKVRFGPPPIQTAEDARMAYLREEINEEEFKEILAHYGHTDVNTFNLGGPQVINLDRMDSAFKRQLKDVPLPEAVTLKDRLDAVETKAKAREAAEKAAPKAEAEVKSTVNVAVDPNEKQKAAAEKVFADAARRNPKSPFQNTTSLGTKGVGQDSRGTRSSTAKKSAASDSSKKDDTSK